MKKLLALVALSCLFVSCAGMSPDHQARAVETIGEMLRSGAISQVQYDALLAALTGGNWLDDLWTIILPILGAWAGVPAVAALARGRVGSRKGLAEAIAKLPHGDMAAAVAAGKPVQ